MKRGLSRRAVLGGTVAVAGVAATVHHVFALGEKVPARPTEIAVESTPFEGFDLKDRGRRNFGKLQYRAGMRLTANSPHFGGFSGLRLTASGKSLVAISDRGTWLTADIREENGAAVGLANARVAPILGPDGKPLGLGRHYDTESLADDGTLFYVGCERTNTIFRFDWGRHGVAARGEMVPVPAEVKAFPNNSGCEALAVVPKGQKLAGALVAIAERKLDANGNSVGVLVGGPAPGAFSVVRKDDFDFTDLCVLPNGDLVLLERFFTFIRGVKMRIRRIAIGDLKPGAVLDGETLIEADLGYEIDNMEGIGVHRDAGGATVLTVISDDNFSPIQRTVLLQFEVKG